MHYVRFLRSPSLSRAKGRPTVNIVFTITTDLGDAFLDPNNPIKLKIGVYDSEADAGGRKVLPADINSTKILEWLPGTRVLKTDLEITSAASSSGSSPWRVFVFPIAQLWGGSTWDIAKSLREDDVGRIMPIWADVHSPGADIPHVSFRRLRIGKEDSPIYLEIEEEIGESIARHVWDAGVVSTSFLLEAAYSSATDGTGTKLLRFLSPDQPVNILELGCGVGILGLGMAAILSPSRNSHSSLLLTDLPEAEKRTQANIDRLLASSSAAAGRVIPSFESLDWEDGRQGAFGPKVASQSWDLLVLSDCTYNVDMLPALVGTLSALHDASETSHRASGGETHQTRVLLATKSRHSSEVALFDLMANDGWSIAEREKMTLPVIGGDMASVEVYLFAK